jgi:hypothetical protein
VHEVPRDKTDLSPASLHFQILLAGTLLFLVALFWLTDWLAGMGAARPVIGIEVLGCYLAFVSVVIGHKVLNSGIKTQPKSGERD